MLRVRQLRQQFSMILEERTRIARELHDTLAQGFVGVSRQLDAIGMRIAGHDQAARQHLELAQEMAHHSLTEAKRAVMDLRASALEIGDLRLALTSAAREWMNADAIPIDVEVSGSVPGLVKEVEHNLLRIVQEAVANALTHAHATNIWIGLRVEAGTLLLEVRDDGCGFDFSDAFATVRGHLGLIGMRERAERLGGELDLVSHLGTGTQVRVTVPLNSDSLLEKASRPVREEIEGTHPRV
jgi:signal transduction histidine kinase